MDGTTHRDRPAPSRWARGRVAAVAVVALAPFAPACAPDPGPPPPCPTRVEVPLEPVDPVQFSLPRGLSADGGWLVATRVVGAEYRFDLRRTTAGAAPVPVGTLPAARFGPGSELLVSVPDGGSQVVFGVAGQVLEDLSAQTTLRRWRAATGTVEDVALPTVAAPPPGVPYTVAARSLSADGRRITWSQAFREGAEPYVWHWRRIVTDAATDAVVSVGPDDPGAIGGNVVADPVTGAPVDLGPDVAAAQAAFPGPPLTLDRTSADLRFASLRRYDPTVVPGLLTYLVWDRRTGTGRVALQTGTTGQPGQPHFVSEALGADGTLLLTRWSSPTYLGDVLESAPGTPLSTVSASVAQLTPQFDWAVSTPDARTVVTSRQGPLGVQLLAHRCS